MPTVLRTLVALALLYTAGAARAAEPAPALASVLPATANAAFILRRDGLVFLRRSLDDDPAMRSELREFLLRTVGVDLSTTDGVAGWLESIDPPVGAVLLTLPAQGDFRGAVVGDEGGVPLHLLGRATAALVPKVGVLVGSELAVRNGVHALQTPSARATWAPVLDAASDLQVVSLAAAFRDPQITAAAQQYGAQWASLSVCRDNRVRLEVAGDGARLKTLLQQAEIFVNVMLEQMRQQKERVAQGDDVLAGVGAISSYHQMLRLWQEAHPKLVGDRIVSDYQIPDLKTSGMMLPVVGIVAAIAVPAFLKYVRRSKTVEATTNLRRLQSGIDGWATAHERKPLPPSTDWAPARGCCGSPKDMCAPDATTAWSAPAWKAFGFSIYGAHYYQYRYTRQTGGRYTIEARGDLDCDGKFSSYKLSGKAGAGSDPLQVTDDLE